MKLTQSEKQLINDKIRQVELETSAEIVTVICKQSDSYLYIPTLWAVLSAMVFSALYVEFFNVLDNVDLLLFQLISFIVLLLVFRWPPLKLLLVPKYIQCQRAHRHAQELFFIEGLHLTNTHTGLMLYVSCAEKYAAILTDSGIKAKISDDEWQVVIDEFTENVRQRAVSKAYLSAIERCGLLLKEHFPQQADTQNINELPDHLIEL